MGCIWDGVKRGGGGGKRGKERPLGEGVGQGGEGGD